MSDTLATVRDELQDQADESTPFPVPTGWTPEQITALAPTLGEKIMQVVRAAESDGVRLRCGIQQPRARAKQIALILLDERGEAVQLRGEDGPLAIVHTASAHIAAYGLVVRSLGEYSVTVGEPTAQDLAEQPADAVVVAAPAPGSRRRAAGVK